MDEHTPYVWGGVGILLNVFSSTVWAKLPVRWLEECCCIESPNVSLCHQASRLMSKMNW